MAFSAEANEQLNLRWGGIDTSGAEQQAMSQAMRASQRAPVVQRLGAKGTAPWIVQFKGAIREEWRAALRKKGATLHGYLPENALLIEATPRDLVRISSLPEVKWVGEYLPVYKRAKTLGVSFDVLVVLFHPEDRTRIGREIAELPGAFVTHAVEWSDRVLIRAQLSDALIQSVSGWSAVEWIEPARTPRPWNDVNVGESNRKLTSEWVTLSEESPALLLATGEAVNAISDPALKRAAELGSDVYSDRWGVDSPGVYTVDARGLDAFVWAHPETVVVCESEGPFAAAKNGLDGLNAVAVQQGLKVQGVAQPSAALVKALVLNGAGVVLDEAISWVEARGLAQGQTDDFFLTVEAPLPDLVVVTMAYSDLPAVSAAGNKRVNDLVLTVTKPQGEVLTADSVDLAEKIEFLADEAGIYRVQVAGRAVPMGGTQPYALAAQGPRLASKAGDLTVVAVRSEK